MGMSHVTTAEQNSTAAGPGHSAVSFKALAWAAQLRGLTWPERGVLIKLADHARDETELAWPSVDNIAKWAGVDERTVRRILGKLLERGLIEVAGANKRSGGKHSTTYRILVPKSFKAGDREAISVRPDGEHRGDISVRDSGDGEGRGDTGVRGGGTPVSPEANKKKLPSKKKHSVLTDGAQGRAKGGQGGSGSKAKRHDDLAVQRQDNEAIRRQWELTGNAQHEAQAERATQLLLRMQPKLRHHGAVCEVYGLKLRYDHTWEPVIDALTECSRLDPPPANPLRWLFRHAERNGNHFTPDF